MGGKQGGVFIELARAKWGRSLRPQHKQPTMYAASLWRFNGRGAEPRSLQPQRGELPSRAASGLHHTQPLCYLFINSHPGPPLDSENRSQLPGCRAASAHVCRSPLWVGHRGHSRGETPRRPEARWWAKVRIYACLRNIWIERLTCFQNL